MRICRRLIFGALAAMMVVAARPASAQYNDEGIGFGVQAGYVQNSISADDIDIDGGSGWLVGIWFGGNRNGVLGFMGELSYQKRAATIAGQGESKTTWLEIPALVRINLGQTSQKNGFIVYPMVGPVVDIQLTNEVNGLDVSDSFEGFDFGVIGGVGVEFSRIGLEVRGNWGMKSLAKEGEDFTLGLEDSKARTLQVNLKIRLN